MPLLRLARALVAIVAAVAVLGVVPLAPTTAVPAHRSGAEAGHGAAKSDRLLRRITSLGLVDTVREQKQGVPRGFRFFHITVEQPVDHDDPDGPTFDQRITVLHRSVKRPTVVFTSGYNLSGAPFRSEPTQLVNGNQIDMEHRFFTPSRPKDPDWARQLTIAQAAADEHRIVKAFQRIYRKNWLATGGSKGGMTATYFRRFYPDDVDGTIPYVAPNDVVDDDDVYDDFLAHVGGRAYAGCRDALVANIRRALGPDRAWFQRRFDDGVESSGATFEIAGDPVVAFEGYFIDAYFVFWEYQGTPACGQVPGPSAGRAEVADFLGGINGDLASYNSDQGLRPLVPYYFQAAYQLGSPEAWTEPFADLLQRPGSTADDVPDGLLDGVAFDDAAMPDIDSWVREDSHHMLYVYGANDPWSAEPFECADDPAGTAEEGAGHACYRFYAPRGNHDSTIANLRTAQSRQAVALVRKWAGLSPAKAGGPGARGVPGLDADWQRSYRRR